MFRPPRRGGRAVECTALEMRHTRKSIEGSNPSLSASLAQTEILSAVRVAQKGQHPRGSADDALDRVNRAREEPEFVSLRL